MSRRLLSNLPPEEPPRDPCAACIVAWLALVVIAGVALGIIWEPLLALLRAAAS